MGGIIFYTEAYDYGQSSGYLTGFGQYFNRKFA